MIRLTIDLGTNAHLFKNPLPDLRDALRTGNGTEGITDIQSAARSSRYGAGEQYGPM